MRVSPFDAHDDALERFDGSVRVCFEQLSGLFPGDDEWLLATLATRCGGLGLRSATRHRAAAYLSSRSQCHELCAELDPAHVWEASDSGSAVARAVSCLNAELGKDAQIPGTVPSPLRQQPLSLALDRASVASLLDPARSDANRRAHIRLQLEHGSGSWLHTIPSANLGHK
eukprot:gene2503-939_t